jgi:branched-chain amino acid transport system permease protein
MNELLAVMPPMPVLMGQLLVGLINGSFYALLSLGLAIIFGLLHIVNFAHGAQYMLGALCTYLLLNHFGIGYWPSLILAPIIVGVFGIVIERLLIRRLYNVHHVYGLMLTFGLALIVEGLVRLQFGSSGNAYAIPSALAGGWNLGFIYLPIYRAWVILASLAICIGTWFTIEKTRLGSFMRAATENPLLTRSFGIRVPLLVTLTYGTGAGLAALAGVFAAPIYQINAQMGADLLIVVFAVVVIGGMGSIKGAIIAGFGVGIAEGLTKTFYPQASTTIVFVIMVIVLLARPSGLFGSIQIKAPTLNLVSGAPMAGRLGAFKWLAISAVVALAISAPFFVYPVFAMKALCFALFASAFNLLLGYGGLLSFGHAAFFGAASYTAAYLAKTFGLDPVLCILSGAVVACVIGVGFGYISVRRQGIYFAMITLALAQMLYFFAVQAPFTGNDEGIQAVPRGVAFGVFDLSNQMTMYYFVLVVVLLSLLFIWRIIHSPFGKILSSVRENEQRAISLGFDADHYKFLAFILSATFSGVAGAMYALVFQLASLGDAHWSTSGHVLLMAIMGGAGTFAGPILGAIIYSGMEHFLVWLGGWINVLHGLIFVLCAVLFRGGIVGSVSAALQSREVNSRKMTRFIFRSAGDAEHGQVMTVQTPSVNSGSEKT